MSILLLSDILQKHPALSQCGFKRIREVTKEVLIEVCRLTVDEADIDVSDDTLRVQVSGTRKSVLFEHREMVVRLLCERLGKEVVHIK